MKKIKPKAIFITGETSSGKSDLAIFLAKNLNGEVINADSRQVYKYLDAGSGKITPQEEKIVKHHLLNIAHPLKNYSLQRWLKDINLALKKILKKNKLPIFCGGTIYYLKALKEGWELPTVKPNYKLRKELTKKSVEELYQEITKLDPHTAKRIDKKNKRRLIRALEIISVLGKVPEIRKEDKLNLLIIAPLVKEKKLFKKIKLRLKKRVPQIIKEIKKLRKIGLSFKRIINFGLEYEWFGKYLKKEIDLKTAKEKCYQDILRFAKRQKRELKKIKNLYWVKNKNEVLKLTKKFINF